MSARDDIKNALADLDEYRALKLVKDALANEVAAFDILTASQQGMTEVGTRFEDQEYFVSDLMMSGEIFKQISAILELLLKAGHAESAGKVVFGTVKGDIHDIGKDIVVNMLKSANFDVIDLGVDVPPEKFINAVKESSAAVLGMSGLLTLAFDSMKATIQALEAAGLRGKVKVMIGGGPVNGTVCKVVGADDWGSDAQQAVKLAKSWLAAAHA